MEVEPSVSTHYVGKAVQHLALIPGSTTELVASNPPEPSKHEGSSGTVGNQISIWSWTPSATSLLPVTAPFVGRQFTIPPPGGKAGIFPRVTGLQATTIENTPTIFASDDQGWLHLFKPDGQPHSVQSHQVGAANGLDIDPISYQALTYGEDGVVNFFSLYGLKPSQKINMSAAGINVARFATSTLIYTASQSSVQTWDLRQNPNEAVQKLIQPQFNFSVWDIAVHPDQPFTCAAGDDEGRVSLWDLRQPKGPVISPSFTDFRHHDSVWRLKFMASSPNILLSVSEDGAADLLDLEPPRQDFPTDVQSSRYPIVFHDDKPYGETRLVEHDAIGIHDFVVISDTLITANNDESFSFVTLPTAVW